jgi:lysyl-tRNA synthetase class I
MLKKLKSLFVIEEGGESDKKIEAKANKKETSKQTDSESDIVQPVSKSKAAQGQSQVVEGRVKDKFLNVLFGAMERNDLEGFDYMEFKQFLKSLDKVQMDEGTKFQSAFATAQTMGASIDILKKSATHYLDILKKEEAKFNAAANNQKEKNLVNKQEEIKHLKAQIEGKTKKIQALQKEIENHQKLMELRSREIASAKIKVEQTKNDFDASYQTLVGQIRSDIKKIDTYLAAPKK